MSASAAEFAISSAQAMVAFGENWARHLPSGAVVFLRGDLGAGKTTLARGILRGLGHRGATPSPTYTLVEAYDLPCGAVYHMDLYRLEDAEELEMLGAREWLDGDAIVLVEWPQRGQARMPAPDFQVNIRQLKQQGQGERQVEVRAADGVALPRL